MVSHNFRNVLLNLVKSIALIQIQCIVHKEDSEGQTEKRSPAYQRRLEKNARAENQKQMNT